MHLGSGQECRQEARQSLHEGHNANKRMQKLCLMLLRMPTSQRASEDVRISYSETVVALEMLNRYGLDEWARNSQKSSEDGHTVSDLIADLHIPAVVFNRHPDGRRESESMMRAVGFRNITFQPTYDSATLDLAALENSGRVSASWDYFTTTLLLYTTIYLSSYCCTTQEECQVVGTISSRHWRGGPIYRLPRNCDTSRMPSTFWM